MLYFKRTDVSGGFDANKISASKYSNICHFFLHEGFKFQ